jgi:hypothetical protein
VLACWMSASRTLSESLNAFRIILPCRRRCRPSHPIGPVPRRILLSLAATEKYIEPGYDAGAGAGTEDFIPDWGRRARDVVVGGVG